MTPKSRLRGTALAELSFLPNQYISRAESEEVSTAVAMANDICIDPVKRELYFTPYLGPVYKLELDINSQKYTLLVVDVHEQTTIDFPALRAKMNIDFFNGSKMHYIEAIGDMGGWSDEGYEAFTNMIAEAYSNSSTVVLFGTTSDVGLGMNGVNNAVTQVLVEHPEYRDRTIGNVVNQTVEAIGRWNCQAPAGLRVYQFVCDFKGNVTFFGNDTVISDGTTEETYSAGGDVEVLLQNANSIAQVKPLSILRGVKLPDSVDGKPLLDSSEITCELAEKASNSNMTNTEMRDWMTDAVNATNWNPPSNDEATKQQCYDDSMAVLFGPKEAWRNAPNVVRCRNLPQSSSLSVELTGGIIGAALALILLFAIGAYCKRKRKKSSHPIFQHSRKEVECLILPKSSDDSHTSYSSIK